MTAVVTARVPHVDSHQSWCPGGASPEPQTPVFSIPHIPPGGVPFHLSKGNSWVLYLPPPHSHPSWEMSPWSSQLLQHTPGSSPSLSLTHQIYSISQTCQVHFLHMSVHLATSTTTTLMQIAFQCPPLHCCGPLPDLPAPLPMPPAPTQ